MYEYNKNKSLIIWIFLVLLCIISSSCEKWTVPPELVGQWETNKQKITVRTSPEKGKYIFTSDSASITITIQSDNTATGSIGDADFENGIIKKNWGGAKRTGLLCKIECGSIGKIFENDPLENKEVQLWLIPTEEGGIMNAELRYTEGGAQFPMAGMIFTKETEE